MTDHIEIKRDPETGEVLSPCCGQPIEFAQTGLRGANCLACGKFVDAQAMFNQLAADVQAFRAWLVSEYDFGRSGGAMQSIAESVSREACAGDALAMLDGLFPFAAVEVESPEVRHSPVMPPKDYLRTHPLEIGLDRTRDS